MDPSQSGLAHESGQGRIHKDKGQWTDAAFANTVHSDWGANFESRLITGLCKTLGSSMKRTTFKHTHWNGLIGLPQDFSRHVYTVHRSTTISSLKPIAGRIINASFNFFHNVPEYVLQPKEVIRQTLNACNGQIVGVRDYSKHSQTVQVPLLFSKQQQPLDWDWFQLHELPMLFMASVFYKYCAPKTTTPVLIGITDCRGMWEA